MSRRAKLRREARSKTSRYSERKICWNFEELFCRGLLRKVVIILFAHSDEFKGHCLLDAARQADVTRLKKYLSSDSVNFKHPFCGDTALVSASLKFFDSLKKYSLRYTFQVTGWPGWVACSAVGVIHGSHPISLPPGPLKVSHGLSRSNASF